MATELTLNEGSASQRAVMSILVALAYADLFDYPLTLREVTQYQVGTHFSKHSVEADLESLIHDGIVDVRSQRYCLKGRESVFELRDERARKSRAIWRRARRYVPVIAHLPFVRMVAATGALAVSNVSARADIDLLVLAEPGRVWICRRFLIALVRLVRLLGDDLCPNYILASNRLELDQRDFFTAHELGQMVPLSGSDWHRALLSANEWSLKFMPRLFDNTDDHQALKRKSSSSRTPILERLLMFRYFDRWEFWEMSRLRRKLRVEVGEAAEVVCTPDQCKGHTGLHRRSILGRLAARLRELGLDGHISGIN